MSSVPKVRSQLTPIKMGPNFSSTMATGVTEALLVSFPHWKLPNGSWSGGGDFYTCRQELTHQGQRSYDVWSNGNHLIGRAGGVSPGPLFPPPFAPPPWSSKRADLKGQYAKGYARTRPGNPVAGMGQFLVELRDLPSIPFSKGLGKGNFGFPIQQVPSLLFERLKDFRSLGSEYLNVVFGWKPFVKDVQDMYNLWHTIDKRIAKIVRENGKGIRRKATIETDATSSQDAREYSSAYVNVNWGMPIGPNVPNKHTSWSYTRTTSSKSWFVGKYCYYIPDTGSSLWNKRARAALFGVLPTPELLWNVLPWTWLIDWFSNVGDIYSNLSPNAVDNLTLKYSFVMKRTESTEIWRSHVEHGAATGGGPGQFGYAHPAGGVTFSKTLKSTEKARVGGGNPFGLDVQLPSLSTYQLAILAALGISRSAVK